MRVLISILYLLINNVWWLLLLRDRWRGLHWHQYLLSVWRCSQSIDHRLLGLLNNLVRRLWSLFMLRSLNNSRLLLWRCSRHIHRALRSLHKNSLMRRSLHFLIYWLVNWLCLIMLDRWTLRCCWVGINYLTVLSLSLGNNMWLLRRLNCLIRYLGGLSYYFSMRSCSRHVNLVLGVLRRNWWSHIRLTIRTDQNSCRRLRWWLECLIWRRCRLTDNLCIDS